MAQTYSARLTNQQEDALEAMERNGDADNKSEALRMAVSEGLHALGYRNGAKTDTALRDTTQRVGDACALLGLLWLGITYLFPFGFRMWAIPIFTIALGLHGLDRVLEQYEPAVSNRLFQWGEQA